MDQKIVKLMLEHLEDGRPYFSKREFESLILHAKGKIDEAKRAKCRKTIGSIYKSLSSLGYIRKNKGQRTLPNTERFRVGLRHLLACTPCKNSSQVCFWMGYNVQQIHYLDISPPSEGELKRFKKILMEEIKP